MKVVKEHIFKANHRIIKLPCKGVKENIVIK